MNAALKQRKKICKKSRAKPSKNSTSLKERSKPVVSGFYRRRVYGNSDKESSHDVVKSDMRR